MAMRKVVLDTSHEVSLEVCKADSSYGFTSGQDHPIVGIIGFHGRQGRFIAHYSRSNLEPMHLTPLDSGVSSVVANSDIKDVIKTLLQANWMVYQFSTKAELLHWFASQFEERCDGAQTEG